MTGLGQSPGQVFVVSICLGMSRPCHRLLVDCVGGQVFSTVRWKKLTARQLDSRLVLWTSAFAMHKWWRHTVHWGAAAPVVRCLFKSLLTDRMWLKKSFGIFSTKWVITRASTRWWRGIKVLLCCQLIDSIYSCYILSLTFFPCLCFYVCLATKRNLLLFVILSSSL